MMRRRGVARPVAMRMVIMGSVVPVIVGPVLGVALGLGTMHRVPGVTVFHTHGRGQRRQAGNRQHQHPAQQSVEDSLHVGPNLVSRGVAPPIT